MIQTSVRPMSLRARSAFRWNTEIHKLLQANSEPIKICFFYSKSHCCFCFLNCSSVPVKPPVVWWEKENPVKQKLKEIKKKEGNQPLSRCWSSTSLITPRHCRAVCYCLKHAAGWMRCSISPSQSEAKTAEPLSGGWAKSPCVFLNRCYLKFRCSRLRGSDFFKVSWKFWI